MPGPAYKAIVGRRFGLGPNAALFEGRPVGAMPQALGRGKTFYVDSAVDASSGDSPDEAVGTLDEAFALTTANRGDVIVVMPNHAETVTGAAGIAHDVAGVSVIGLGIGNQRPRFLMDAGTSVTYAITADDAYLENLVFASGHSNVVACITTTKKHSWFYNLEFENNTTNEDFLTPIKATSTTDNDSDGLRVVGCRWLNSDADSLEFLEINANLRGLVFQNNFLVTAGAANPPSILTAGTKNLTAALITHNFISSAATSGDMLLDNGASDNTGICAYNIIGNLDTTGAQLLGVAAGIQFFENYMTSTSTESGGLQLTADSPNS